MVQQYERNMITNLWNKTKTTFIQLNPTTLILTPLLLALAIPYQLKAAGPATLDLLSNTNFAVLAETQITTTGGGSVNGNIGLSPAAGTFIFLTCPQVNGTIYVASAGGSTLGCQVLDASRLTQAVNDMVTSYGDAAGRTPVPSGPNLNPGAAFSTGVDIGGLTLAPGLYKFDSSTTCFINTDVTLSGGPNDVWIFQCGADLEEANGVHITLAGGANANNIFWQVATKAVLGTTTVFNGTILAGTSITMNTGSTMNGRALAQAAVTFNGTGAALPVTAPVVGVQQPAGTNLVNNAATNDFGSVAVGTNTSHIFAITNNGSANLTISGITIDGTNAGSFSVINLTATLSPGASTNFVVNFAPTNAGAQIAALHIASNDPTNGLFNIVLTGTGTNTASPVIGVQQPAGTNLVNGVTNNFGSVVVGTNTSLTFTITNFGGANLIISGITIDGANSTMFAVTNLTATVGPGGNTNFTVRFTPASIGVKIAALHIASNATNNPFNINLTGTGVTASSPVIGVQQPAGTNLVNNAVTNNFGSVAVGSNISRIFTITNSGNANLTNLLITIDGTDAAMFIVTTNPATSVSPGSDTTFTVRFAPVSAGTKTAALHIASNDPTNNPFNIVVTGTGAGEAVIPGIVVQQPAGTNLVNNTATNNFGSVAVGTNTSLTFTITNFGGTNLIISGITIDGTNSAQFTVTNLTATVGPGGSTNFTVLFTPASTGLKTAALHIANNDVNNNPFNIVITGAGTDPSITVSTNDFITYISTVAMNLPTGLFTNSVVVTNGSPNTIAAVRLLILNLPADVQVNNASGYTTNGTPYVQYNFPFAPGAVIDFTIEYYRSSRVPFSPTYLLQDLTNAVTLTTPTNSVGIKIDKITSLSGGMLIGFYATPGRSYAVQYSTNMVDWLTADPFVVAMSNYEQWFDQGPPKTQTLGTTRFYRAFELR